MLADIEIWCIVRHFEPRTHTTANFGNLKLFCSSKRIFSLFRNAEIRLFCLFFSGSKSLIFYGPSPVFVVRRIISRATLHLAMESCEGLPCLCPQRCHFLHFLHNQPQPQGFPVINLAQHVICKVSDRSSVRTSHQLSLFKVIFRPIP